MAVIDLFNNIEIADEFNRMIHEFPDLEKATAKYFGILFFLYCVEIEYTMHRPNDWVLFLFLVKLLARPNSKNYTNYSSILKIHKI